MISVAVALCSVVPVALGAVSNPLATGGDPSVPSRAMPDAVDSQQLAAYPGLAKAGDLTDLDRRAIAAVLKDNSVAYGYGANPDLGVRAFRPVDGDGALRGGWVVAGSGSLCLLTVFADQSQGEIGASSCAETSSVAARGLNLSVGGYGSLRDTDRVRVVGITKVGATAVNVSDGGTTRDVPLAGGAWTSALGPFATVTESSSAGETAVNVARP